MNAPAVGAAATTVDRRCAWWTRDSATDALKCMLYEACGGFDCCRDAIMVNDCDLFQTRKMLPLLLQHETFRCELWHANIFRPIVKNRSSQLWSH
jgi:hypothetical protein